MIICRRKGCVYNDGGASRTPNIRVSADVYCLRYFARSNSQPDPPAYLDNTYSDFLEAMDEVSE